MAITKQIVAQQLVSYLRHEMVLAQLVDWAENVLMDGEIEEQVSSELASMVARLGMADVRAFGLTWEDCQAMLRMLGYVARVEIVPI